LITCRQCGKEFAKPTTRGRPRVKCEDCRAGKKPKAVEIPAYLEEIEKKPNLKSVAASYFRADLIEHIEQNPEFVYFSPLDKATIIRSLSDSV